MPPARRRMPVWTEGAFGLATSTIAGLKKNLRDSDFGIFVFAPDDVADIKGRMLKVPRDNVVYEAGLFSGYLCPERCFIVVPETVQVHLPTDLRGITVGFYEDIRSDDNHIAAVGTFCADVKREIASQGLFDGLSIEALRELNTKFECCDWITDEATRVQKKKEVASEIDRFCRDHPVNKHRLLARHRSGHYMALLSAVRNRPERGDCALLVQMRTDKLPPGFAYYRILDAAESIKAPRRLCTNEIAALSEWLKKLPQTPTALSLSALPNFRLPESGWGSLTAPPLPHTTVHAGPHTAVRRLVTPTVNLGMPNESK